MVILASSVPAKSQSSSSDMTASEVFAGRVRLRRSAGTNTAREHSLWRCDAAVGAPRGCQRQPRPEAQAPAPAKASMRPNTIEASIVDKVHGEHMWITPGTDQNCP